MFPKKYLSQDNSIATYNFTDIANGIGYVNYYPCALVLSGSTTYGMVKDTSITSGEVVKKITNTGTSDTDYDLVFNTPKSINGVAYLNYVVGSAGGASNTFTQARLFKYDGSTETQLGATYTTNSAISTGAIVDIRNLVKFDLTGQTYVFGAGDILRLSIYMQQGGAGSGGYSQDPSASADSAQAGLHSQVIDTAYSTRMTLSIPFKLDV